MEIVKELNKDGGYESIKNGSMTHAVNAMVSRDGNSIQNEQSIETIITLSENEEIVGVISCSDEIVIFTNNSKIRRYKESTKAITEVATNWNYQGGKVIGTYTYNVNNELIVAITELNSDEEVPLKIINLNKPNYLEGGSDIKYTLVPNIPKTNLNNSKLVSGSAIYKGIYNFFIRYKEGSDYTGWFPIGTPVLVWDKGNQTTIEDNSFGYDNSSDYRSVNYKIGNFTFKEDTNLNTEKVNLNIELGLRIDNSGLNYIAYQIGYIINTQKGDTKVYNTSDIDIKTSRITIDDVYNETFSLDDITSSFFNLYNVKTLCNYNNRLYVANYKEENINSLVSSIDTSNIQVRVKDFTGNKSIMRRSVTRAATSSIVNNPRTFDIGKGYVVTIKGRAYGDGSEYKGVTRRFFLTRIGKNSYGTYCLMISSQDFIRAFYKNSGYDSHSTPFYVSYQNTDNLYEAATAVVVKPDDKDGYILEFSRYGSTYYDNIYPDKYSSIVDLGFVSHPYVRYGRTNDLFTSTSYSAPNIQREFNTDFKVVSIEEFDLTIDTREIIEPMWFYLGDVTIGEETYKLKYDRYNTVEFYYKIYDMSTGSPVDKGIKLRRSFQTAYVDYGGVLDIIKAKFPNSTIYTIDEYETINPTGAINDVKTQAEGGLTEGDKLRIAYDVSKNKFMFATEDSRLDDSYWHRREDAILIINSEGETSRHTIDELFPNLSVNFNNENKSVRDLINEIEGIHGTLYKWKVDREPTDDDFNIDESYTVDFNVISSISASLSSTKTFTDLKAYPVGYIKETVEEGHQTIIVAEKEFMIVIPFINYLKTVSTYDYKGNEGYTIYDRVSVESTEAYEGVLSNLYICFQKNKKFNLDGISNYDGLLLDIPTFGKDNVLAISEGGIRSSGSEFLELRNNNKYKELRVSGPKGGYTTYAFGFASPKILDSETKPEDTKFYSDCAKYAINQCVYNFFIHYVHPNGNITDGINIPNTMSYSETISLGRASEGNTLLTMDINEDTLISDIKAKFDAYKSRYGYINTNNAHDVVNIFDSISNVRFCNIFPKYNSNGIALYKNNNGNRMFRGTRYPSHRGIHQIKFLFDNIPMRKEFVGYFISYEKTEPILVSEGVPVRRDDDFNTAFNEQVDNIRFYYPEFNIIKKPGAGNIFITGSGYTMGDAYKGPMFTDYYSSGIDFNQSHPLEEFGDIRAVKSSTIIMADSKDDNNAGREAVVNLVLNKSLKLGFYTADGRGYVNSLLLNISDNLYMSENKDLIPLGYIKYVGSTGDIYNYGYEDYIYNYNYYIVTAGVYAFNRNGVYYNTTDPIPKKATDNTNLYPNFPRVYWEVERVGNTPISRIIRKWYSLYPLFAKTIKTAPDERYYTIHTDNNSFVQNVRMIHLLPTTINDTFEISSIYLDYVGKKFIKYNELLYSNFVTEYCRTIRRSDVISDESVENKWQIFRPNAYKIISENKGDIINVIGIGTYLIAHCEHSMFIFNRDNTLYTKDKDVQMLMPDAFDIDYQEVFTSEKGYAGLQDFEAYVCNEAGYIFLDRSKKRLYRFDEKNLNDLGDGVQSILDEYLTSNTQILMGMDKENNRLICSFMGDVSDFTLSYNFVTNTWISVHTYLCRGFYNTKTNLYISSFNKKNIIGQLGFVKPLSYLKYKDFEIAANKNPFYVGDNNNTMVVDVLFNLEYDTIKVLNYISYDLYKANDINFAGNKILLFSNTSISRLEDITVNERNTFDTAKPYYEHGKWNYNYFRSVLNEVVTNYPIDRLTGKLTVDVDKNYEPFKSNLINGKYLGVRFVINDGTAKIEIKKIECYVNKYRE
jgi:hypothetical protein